MSAIPIPNTKRTVQGTIDERVWRQRNPDVGGGEQFKLGKVTRFESRVVGPALAGNDGANKTPKINQRRHKANKLIDGTLQSYLFNQVLRK